MSKFRVKLTPTKPFMFEGREVEYLVCKPNGNDHLARKEKIATIGRANAKPIVCINNSTEYPSSTAAAEALGLNKVGVSRALNGKIKSTKGFTFKYKE
jgi:hypothetical protein